MIRLGFLSKPAIDPMPARVMVRFTCLAFVMILGACAARQAPPPVQTADQRPLPQTVPLIPNRVAPPPAVSTQSKPTAPLPDIPESTVQVLSFSALNGWSEGDHVPVLETLRIACEKITDAPADSGLGGHEIGGKPLFGTGGDWSSICRQASSARDAKDFFEDSFIPVALGGSEQGAALFTAYYEPELKGSRTRGGPYQYPLYARPDDLQKGVPYFDRAAIDAGALAGRGLELFWLDDPVESFFLHIQGSGRIRLPDGSVARVGYAGKNGHSYKAIGRTLIEWGEVSLKEVSKRRIEEWIKANPGRRDELLGTNPSYVFFIEREELNADPSLGPVGSFGQPLPAQRAIAVDPAFYPLGVPVWVELTTPVGPVRRLTLALDTGGAIKGARRADYFFGSGDAAGMAAGSTRDRGRMIALTPRVAYERIFGPLS